MIKVTIYKNKENYINGYRLTGHAGYDTKGKDIVCAAASVLAQTSLISLVEVCGIPQDEIAYTIDDKEGLLSVILPEVMDREAQLKTDTVLRTLEIGLKSIIESYPGYISLKYGRWNK